MIFVQYPFISIGINFAYILSTAMSSGQSGLWFKRSLRGLYAGKERLTGNHVSPSKAHVKRAWLPNVQRKNLWSDILKRYISINVTTHALKAIDRVGGQNSHQLLCRTPHLTDPMPPWMQVSITIFGLPLLSKSTQLQGPIYGASLSTALTMSSGMLDGLRRVASRVIALYQPQHPTNFDKGRTGVIVPANAPLSTTP